MGTIPIDWNKLRDYKADKRKSFEELCFQVAYENYSNEGTFIPIDDSGGGSGVEFYLVRPNGGIWGWQAKFYPHGRFTKTRRAQVKSSLKQSLKDHKRLEKWFLCSPTDFTTQGKNPETKWFHTDLRKIAPDVELIYWGERFLVNQLATPKLLGRRLFFFGDLELSSQWCRNQVAAQLEAVGNKYIPGLHTGTGIDEAISDALGDCDAQVRIRAINIELRKAIDAFNKGLSALEGIKEKWPQSYAASRNCAREVITIFESAVTVGGIFYGLLVKSDTRRAQSVALPPGSNELSEALKHLSLNDLDAARNQARKDENEAKYQTIANDYKVAEQPAEIAEKYSRKLDELRIVIKRFRSSTLNVLGSAGYGKTHISCAIADSRTRNNLPAILLRGIRFTREAPIKQQIPSLLGIAISYSWEDFLSAVSAMAMVYRTRVCLIIDGLNEAEELRRLQIELPEITADISRYQNIVLVTTCRSNYRELVWTDPETRFLHLAPAEGETLEQITRKYFAYYRLAVTTAFASLETLSNPLYLRLFCEANNHSRQATVSVHLADQTILITFRKYLVGALDNIGKKLDRPNARELVDERLRSFAKQLWESSARELPLQIAAELLEGVPVESRHFKWTDSITKALLDEDLIITRERTFQNGSGEVVRFTYDLLAGLLIAEGLFAGLKPRQAQSLIGSGVPCLTDEQQRHPLWDDITRCICLITPEQWGFHVYDVSTDPTLFSASVNAMFEMDPSSIRPKDARLVESLVGIDSNRKLLLSRLWQTATVPYHPLNATLLDRVLHRTQVVDRELSWTENLRRYSERFRKLLSQVWDALNNLNKEDHHEIQRIKLAGILTKWLLTSTEHRLRDLATRTLTRIGSVLPDFLFGQTLSSLTESDPYVPERMLASAYAVVMRLHCRPKSDSFRQKQLPYFANSIYWMMFAPGAEFSTTHALTREYARGILECAQRYHPTLFHYAQRDKDGRIKFPGPAFKWREYEFPPVPNEYVNDHILGMDWGNYTVGHLVPARSPYEFAHPTYKSIRRNVLWRVSQLGYDPVRFASADREIAHFHWNRTDQNGRTDRYGKKYAWIAYFELYGLLYDAGELRGGWSSRPRRPMESDIDPSFPRARWLKVANQPLIEECNYSPSGWLRLESAPKHIKPLLVGRLVDNSHEWVLLDGWQNNHNIGRRRNSFCMIRMYLVPKGLESNLIKLFKAETPRGGWLDHKEDERGVFGGEVPWSIEAQSDGLQDLEFTVGVRKIWRDRTALDAFRPNVQARRDGKVRDEERIVEHIDALIPVRHNEFSTRSPIRRDDATIPSQSLLLHADLAIRAPYWDFYDKSGELAGTYVQFGGHYDSQNFTYFRKDLFDRFLSDQSMSAVWVIWGERQLLTPSGMDNGYRQYKELEAYKSTAKL